MTFLNANVYQHFREDERPFIDIVEEWLEKVEMQYAPVLTDFLDPRQAYILETLIRQKSDLCFRFYGGYESSERTRCLIIIFQRKKILKLHALPFNILKSLLN